MTAVPEISFSSLDLDKLATAQGCVAVLVKDSESKEQYVRRCDRLTRGAVARALSSERFAKLKIGETMALAWPSGMAAETLILVYMPARPTEKEMLKAGAALGQAAKGKALSVVTGSRRHAEALAEGAQLGAYRYQDGKSKAEDEAQPAEILCSKPEEAEAAFVAHQAVAEGVYLTRDLVNAPANFLTTTAFAEVAENLKNDGVEVEILDEKKLEELGMRLLLSVGQGSVSPSYVAVMRWQGGEKDAKPLALIGKGVVFDTGGISLKPAAGMEDMTMDMGGAGVVTGVMKTVARRKAAANVVGLIGLVENMPSGNAIRPGDVVASMKGDTVEIINTDAEGRLVLADVLHYAQTRFDPDAMVDLATLTGAMIIALGHEKAGVFANDDAFANDFLNACDAADEGAWRLPLGDAYDAMLKSDVADMKNVGGRAAGSITAAQFLQRFVDEGRPWIHLDIAGVASLDKPHSHGPKGASGWGVRALDRLIRDRFETSKG